MKFLSKHVNFFFLIIEPETKWVYAWNWAEARREVRSNAAIKTKSIKDWDGIWPIRNIKKYLLFSFRSIRISISIFNADWYEFSEKGSKCKRTCGHRFTVSIKISKNPYVSVYFDKRALLRGKTQLEVWFCSENPLWIRRGSNVIVAPRNRKERRWTRNFADHHPSRKLRVTMSCEITTSCDEKRQNEARSLDSRSLPSIILARRKVSAVCRS